MAFRQSSPGNISFFLKQSIVSQYFKQTSTTTKHYVRIMPTTL